MFVRTGGIVDTLTVRSDIHQNGNTSSTRNSENSRDAIGEVKGITVVNNQIHT